MGLSMYAFSVAPNDAFLTDDINERAGSMECTYFHEWYNHHTLHMWMEALWRSRRFHLQAFNLTPLLLSSRCLDALEHTLRKNQLPKLDPAYCDESNKSRRPDDLAFIAEARAEIARGRLVYFSSWW